MIFASLNVNNFIERTFIAYIHSVVKFVNEFFSIETGLTVS